MLASAGTQIKDLRHNRANSVPTQLLALKEQTKQKTRGALQLIRETKTGSPSPRSMCESFHWRFNTCVFLRAEVFATAALFDPGQGWSVSLPNASFV